MKLITLLVFWCTSIVLFAENFSVIDSTIIDPPHNYDRAMKYLADDKKHEALIVSIFMAKSENLEEAVDVVQKVKGDSTDQYIIDLMESAFWRYAELLPHRRLMPISLEIFDFDDYDYAKGELLAKVTSIGKEAHELDKSAISNLAQNKNNEAERDLLQGIELMPTLKRYLLLGQLYELQGKVFLAEETYEKGLELQNYQPFRYRKYIQIGISAIEMRYYEWAIENFTKVIESDYENLHGKAHYERGRAYMGLENYESAIKDLDNAVISFPTFKTFLLLGLSYSNLDKNKKALEIYNQALEIHGGHAELYVAMAYAVNEFKQELCYLQKALEKDSTYGPAYNLLGIIYWNTKKKRHRKTACEYWEKGSELDEADSKDLYRKYCR